MNIRQIPSMCSPRRGDVALGYGSREQKKALLQMQKLCEPPHGRILRSLKGLPLLPIALIATYGESVHRAGEVLVVVIEAQAGDHAVGVRLQLGGQHRVVLRGDDLYGDGDGVDFLLCEEGRVRGGDAVDEVFAWRSWRVSVRPLMADVGY